MNKIKRSYDEIIYQNTFTKTILSYFQNVFQKHEITDAEDLELFSDYNSLSPEEKYILDISKTVFDITNIWDQLSHIPTNIKYFPRLKSYQNNKITKDAYIRYHLENHYIRVSTIIDQLALLINQVYRLGLSPQRCSIEAILDNANTKDTKVAHLLKKFKKSVQGIKSIRNKIVHQGRSFYDEDIQNLATYIFLNEQNEKEVIPQHLVEFLHKSIIHDKVSLLSKNNEAVLHYIVAIFKELEGTLKETYEIVKTRHMKFGNVL